MISHSPTSAPAPRPANSNYPAEYETLRARGVQATEAGRLDEAQRHFDAALAMARAQGDERRAELAFCNLTAVRIERGEGDRVIGRLRQVLMGNGDPETCRLAAYNLARHYHLAKAPKKGLFYARLARDRSRTLERQDWIASSHNQIGNLLLAESRFAEAIAEYQVALALLPREAELRRALALDNLGYCRLATGDHGEGFRYLFSSLRTLRRLGARLWLALPHVSLAYGYLEIDRPERARRHAEAALALAQEVGDPQSIRMALYLLGEATHLTGDPQAAHLYFSDLQRRFFPEVDGLPELLMQVGIRQMVHLKG